jgi:hypothetical protein
MGAIWGIWPALCVTIVSSIIQPVNALRLFIRTFEVAEQQIGWTIPFINPWILSGIPVYKKLFFYGERMISPLYYLLFFFLIVIGTYFIYKNLNSQKKLGFDRTASKKSRLIWAASGSFMATVLIYLGAFLTIGNKYQVWKFASFICLPLSFVPLAVLFYFVKITWLDKSKAIALLIIISLFSYWGYTVNNLRPFIGRNQEFWSYNSPDEISKIFEYIFKTNDNLALYLGNFTNSLFFAEFYKGQSEKKFLVVIPLANFMRQANFQSIFKTYDDIAIVSDRDFPNLFNGERGDSILGKIYLSSKENLVESGYASILGVHLDNDWLIPSMNIFLAVVNIPKNLHNKPVKVKITIGLYDKIKDIPYDKDYFTKLRLWVQGMPEPVYGQEGSYEIETSIPPELIVDGSFSARVKILGAEDAPKDEVYKGTFVLERVEVEEDFSSNLPDVTLNSI